MINKLIEKIRKTNAPIVVGLDPMLNYIPKHIQEKAFAEFGETREFDTLKSKKVPQSLEIGLFFCQIFIFTI